MKITKKIITLLLLLSFISIAFSINSHAASASISASSSVEVGTPITISVSGSGVQWNLSLKVNGTEIAKSQELDNYESNKSISFSGTYTPTSAGSLDVTLTGSVTEFSDGSTIKDFSSKTISVIEPAKEESEPEQGTSTPTQENTPSSNDNSNDNAEETNEPTFTSVNKTVYATGDINLRESWSTSSSRTEIKKDTELTLTGTSTETVNGYVWYRVTYEGKTRYVARNLITETKPDSNLSLKKLEIEGIELSPVFSADVTEYTAKTTNYTEKEFKVTAEAEDSKSTVKIEGNKNVVIGENTITVTVTDKDNNKKEYKIKITNEKSDAFGLKTLKINSKIPKGFAVDKYEYDFEFTNMDKLNIEAIANQDDAKVEILGNENLKDGKNVVTIIVTSKDGKTVVTYQINANKTVMVQKENEGLDTKSIIICSIAGAVVLISTIILIVKYVRNKKESIIDYGYNDNLNEEDDYIVSNDNLKNKKKKDTFNYDEENNDEDEESINDDNDVGSEEIYINDSEEEIYNDDIEFNNEEDNYVDDIELRKKTKKSRKINPEYTVDDLFNENYKVEELPEKKENNKNGKHSK